ncbi:MAG: hypothetical protein A2497_00730 [Candidatus Firestonebacteria bacterium RifOxyC12_full_39_7]|nr:MAG: hypothetical protein A2497_00730 [Candidatus Firestonebacteria bacterium RifOxyC12_full_39_7]
MLRFVAPVIWPDTLVVGILGGVVLWLAVVIWWAFFSRAAKFDRWAGVVLMIAVLVGITPFLDASISTANMGLMFIFFSLPVLSLAFVIWAAASRNLGNKLRRITMVLTILLSTGFWLLLRTDGMTVQNGQYLNWRWAKTNEEKLLSEIGDNLTTTSLTQADIAKEAEWPGFRGKDRDSIAKGIKIGTDWAKNPPVEMWRSPIGPGCSSFAVHGSFIFTQEQRGEYEMVTCYNLNTGKPVWKHGDKVRFWDSHAGAGPRSTPTISKGRVYTLGATGLLNVLDERTGNLVWMRDAAKDTDVKIPVWGYTSSPLVVDSVVVVAISSRILAYDIATGKPRWNGSDTGESYSSAHLLTLDGVRQIVFMNKAGVAGYAVDDGKELWKIVKEGIRTIQPALINDTDILIDMGEIKGLRRISLKHTAGKWSIEEKWTSTKLKPNSNDIIIHKGYVYGFDIPSLTCIDIEKGERKWKDGRYSGELILLADQDLLLVLSEKGELALVPADPKGFKELARFSAITGKTWNHPAIAGSVLLLRNTKEMAAFRLPLEDK